MNRNPLIFCLLPIVLAIQSCPTVGAVEMPDRFQRVALYGGDVPDAPPQSEREPGDDPEMWVRIVASKDPTGGVVILPGGGYGGHALDHEGIQIADWLESMGISSAILQYRLRGAGNRSQGYGHPVPMNDAQHALQKMRSRASDWNIDSQRIGVIGFSAGGHLASTVATTWSDQFNGQPISSRPDFAIICYPVISLGKPWTHRGSQRNLLGKDASDQMLQQWSSENRVTDQTPPIFLFHTVEDKAVPAQNSLEFASACVNHHVPVELHLFPRGGHGLGLAADVPGASQWPGLCRQWLTRLGITDPRNDLSTDPVSDE